MGILHIHIWLTFKYHLGLDKSLKFFNTYIDLVCRVHILNTVLDPVLQLGQQLPRQLRGVQEQRDKQLPV